MDEPSGPGLRIGRLGVSVPRAADVSALRDQFARAHHVRLDRFFDRTLIDVFRRRLPDAAFRPRVEQGVEIEHMLEEPALLGLMLVTLNDPALFAAIDAITGCGTIGCFSGRIMRKLASPGGGHYYPWHTDATQDRLVGLSVNLGDAAYRGGVLEMRYTASGEPVASLQLTGPGNAVLFRISPDLEHHVTPVEGDEPRIVLVGWFRRQPDFWARARTCASS